MICIRFTQHRQLRAVCSTTSAISYSVVPLHRHHLVHHWSSLGTLNMDTFPVILLHFQYLPLNPFAGAEWTGYWGQSCSRTNYCIFLLFSFSFVLRVLLSTCPSFYILFVGPFSDELANANPRIYTLRGSSRFTRPEREISASSPHSFTSVSLPDHRMSPAHTTGPQAGQNTACCPPPFLLHN